MRLAAAVLAVTLTAGTVTLTQPAQAAPKPAPRWMVTKITNMVRAIPDPRGKTRSVRYGHQCWHGDSYVTFTELFVPWQHSYWGVQVDWCSTWAQNGHIDYYSQHHHTTAMDGLMSDQGIVEDWGATTRGKARPTAATWPT